MANKNAGGAALSGAASGAAIGSVVPGVGTAIGAVAGGVIGLVGSSKGDDNSAQQEQLDLQKRDLAFRQQVYDHEVNMTDPLRKQLTAEAMSGQALDYAINSAEIKKNYAAMGRKNLALGYGTGMAGAGLDIARSQTLAMGEASDLAGAWAKGLQAKRQLGQNLLQIGLGAKQNAASGVSQATQGLASTYGQLGAQENQEQRQMWENTGQAASGLAYQFGKDRVLQDKTVLSPGATTIPTIQQIQPNDAPIAPQSNLGIQYPTSQLPQTSSFIDNIYKF